ncbi:MAG: hypothetical protein H7Y33_12815 [Cytophagales bacterium]|nr:hypothetical protein [Rhizobacter sp.]
MQIHPHPETLGAFSPVNHVVMSFPTADDMEGAAQALAQQGWDDEQLIHYTPSQMKKQAEFDIANASPLAELGQEVNLVRAHRDLADKGYSFLIVPADSTDLAQKAAEIGKGFHAERAQRYGNFLIEELIEARDDEAQVFESPDRGLDAQTPSGEEKDRSTRR